MAGANERALPQEEIVGLRIEIPRHIFLDKWSPFQLLSQHRISLGEGRFLDAILKVERVRFPRAVSQTAPGRLGHQTLYAVCGNANCYAPPALRPARPVERI